jgi:thiamine pyrophosphate-dependent acetolactate synthase large subunit-like protein
MTDGLYGSVACSSNDGSESRRAVTILGRTWWQAAEAFGCESARVESSTELEAAIAAWARRGPLFLEAPFDPARYAVMTADLR